MRFREIAAPTHGLIRAYHGTKTKFTAFDPNRAADGHAQEGCGFYFTTSERDARRYVGADGHVLVCDLDVHKVLPPQRWFPSDELRILMRGAPDLDETLLNWDEDPVRAFTMAMRSMAQGEGAMACLQNVWYDFYRDHPAAFLTNVAKLGYGGSLIPREDENGESIVHIVMYDVNKIRIVETR